MDRLRTGNSRTRLAAYRIEAANGKWVRPLTWRDTKQHHTGITYTPNNARGKDGEIFTDSVDQYGDYLGHSGLIARRAVDHSGWYADSFQSDLIIGGVAKLRTPRGTLYIPVTQCTGWDGTIHYMHEAELVPRGSDQDAHDVAIRDMAIRADRCAELEAEEARENDAKCLADIHIEECRSRIHEINRECLALLREIKSQSLKFGPAVCGALRASVARLLADRREQFETIAQRQSDYWSAVEW